MENEEDISKLARLARLEISPDQLKSYGSEVRAILNYVAKLNSLDLKDVEPMSHVHGSYNVFREDQKVDTLTQDEALDLAPQRLDSYFVVPITVDSGE